MLSVIIYVWLIRIFFFIAIFFAIRKGKNWKRKVLHISLVVLVFGFPRWSQWPSEFQHKRKYEIAKALFDERCKSAGEKIYKTVDDVEGVLLLNVRSNSRDSDKYDPNWIYAGMPKENTGDDYISTFLTWEHHEDKRNPRGQLRRVPSSLPGYQYVDVKDENGVLWRYTLGRGEEVGYPFLEKMAVRGQPARYGVSFKNMINPDDRQYWVAGTMVTVTDMRTLEILAEGTWYSFATILGVGRQSPPWNNSINCPNLNSYSPTRYFVDQVLKSKKGD